MAAAAAMLLSADTYRAGERVFGLRLLAALVLAGLVLASGPALAQDSTPLNGKAVTVGVYTSPPFVTATGDGFGGIAIELWEHVAARLGLATTFREFTTIRDLIAAAEHGDIDVAVTNLSITQSRALRIDFTQPWFDSGLRIMVSERPGAGFWDVIEGLEASGFVRTYVIIALLVMLATAILTLVDRRYDPAFPRRWRDGVAESFFSVMSVATGKLPPTRNRFGWIGRLWQGLWLMCGVAVVAFVTSSITTVMTTISLTSQIKDLSDLDGRAVGAFTGSLSEDFARQLGLDLRTYPHVEEAVAALQDRSIVAIIADAPVLEYFAHTNPQLPLDVTGNLFRPDKYGFGLAPNSPLTDPVTIEILGAKESGYLESLRSRYFGNDN